MKIIDLLNKIANGEEVPKKIKISIYKYEWKYDVTREEYTYMQETGERLDDDILLLTALNSEIEIIEEPKKIEKMGKFKPTSYELARKLDEIIDYINRGNDE